MADNPPTAAPARSQGDSTPNGDKNANSFRSGNRPGDRNQGGRGRGGGRGGNRGRGRGFGSKDLNGRQKKGDLGRGEWSRNDLDKRKRNEEERAKRRKNEEEGGDPASAFGFSKEEIEGEARKPKRKVAVMIGYAGSGYKGMQINAQEKTIEGDIFKAFVAAGAISKANADDPKKSSLVRCARTDKGVHAAGNVISLKLIVEDPEIIQKINDNLPPQIRVWGLERTNGSFSCYQTCDSRWYEYLIPTYSFIPPHPQSFLGKKLVESAEKEGVFESYQARQEDAASFWKKAEEKYVKPILDNLEPEMRETVMAVVHSSEEVAEEVGAIKKAMKQQYKQAAKPVAGAEMGSKPTRPAAVGSEQPQDDPAETDAEKMDDVVESEENKSTEELKDEVEAAASKKRRAEAAEEEEERSSKKRRADAEEDAMTLLPEVDDGKTASDGPEDKQEATATAEDGTSKSVLTPFEAAIKEVKAAYIVAKKAYRVSQYRRDRVQEALDCYLGTRNFHNYTIQKSFSDPSAKRVIRSFKVGPEPVIINDTEWLSLKVHGQSFMMHQIRKMIAMAALVVRCGSPKEIIAESFGSPNISIPKAPGLGLLLERPIFDNYNERAVREFGREKIDFDKYQMEMDEFKQREIYDRIFREEEKDHQFHTFFHHVDHYRTDYFLWVTASGIAAAKQSKAPARTDDASDDEVADANGEEG